MKIYISADMEGIAGVVTEAQLGPEGFEYERARQWMTDEVVAVVRAAQEAGASEVVVSDSHGNGQNILLDSLPESVELIRSWPRPLGMMEGIDSSFDAAILLGYHTGTHNANGVRAHTFSSAHFARVSLNGVAVGEAEISAAIAGHFGVPVVLVTGDDHLEVEIRERFEGVMTAVTKRSMGFHSVRTLAPTRAQALLEEKTKEALAQRGSIAPVEMSGEVTLDLTFKCYRPAEALSYLSSVERVDSHTVRYLGENILAISRFLIFVLHYRADLTP